MASLGLARGQGVITTFAGTDAKFSGDGQSALNAGLGLITGIAAGSNGSIYFNDPDNHIVLRLDADGTLHVIAGNGIGGYSGDGGPAVNASIGGDETAFDLQLGPPTLNGIAVDGSGNVFIASGNLVRRIDPSGTITTYAGGGANKPGDGGQATQAVLGKVLGVAVDKSGNVYFVDRSNSVVRKVVPDGAISTVAGIADASGFSGDGGPAVRANLNNPSGIACDSQGNVYIAEQFPGRIRKIAVADGNINTVAGGGDQKPGKGVPPLQVDINSARAVAVDSNGNIYTFAPGNGTLIKFAANGDSNYLSAAIANTQFTLSNVPATQIYINGAPFSNSSLAVDAAGNVYTAQEFRGLLRKIDTGGIITTIAGNDQYRFSPDGIPAASAQLRSPVYLTVGADGSTVYFLSSNGLRKVGSDGILTTASNQAPFKAPALVGLVSDSAGNFYTLLNSTVVRLSPNGVSQTLVNLGNGSGSAGDEGAALGAQLNQPRGLAVDKAGNLFIADSGNFKIRKVTPDQIIHTIAGTGQAGHSGDGGLALNATFNALGAMLADNRGGVYVIDGSYIRHVLNDGTIQAVAGNGRSGFSGDGGKAVNASISVESRSGLALDAVGNLYFSGSDFESHIRRITPDNTISTVAGNGIQGGFAGDGGPAALALFNEPLGLAFDAAGNLFVADSGNNRIRVILASHPAIGVDVTDFSFGGSAGGAPQLAQYLTVTGSIDAIPFTIAQSPDSGWLSVSTSSGVTPRVIQLTADPSQLKAQNYQATLTVEAPGANPATIPITVDFNVLAAAPPRLALDKARLSFTYPMRAAPISELVEVRNAGSGPLQIQVAAETSTGGNWLSVSRTTGTATPTNRLILGIKADPSGLDPGTYSGTVTVSAASLGGNGIAIPVTMTISSATQAIRLSQSGLTFTAVQQGGVVPVQTFAVLNIGTGVMNWTASTTTRSGGQQWLSASPASGSSSAGDTPPLVTVAVNPAGLAPGRYYGLVQIAASGAANTPHVITVVLRVLPMATDIAAVVTPNDLVFTATVGAGSPGSKSVFVYNIAATPKTFSSSAFTGAVGLDYLPGQATLALNAPTEIVIQPITDGLAPGTYRGNLTLQFSDGRVRDVRLHIVVKRATGSASTAAAVSGENPRAAGCAPTKLVPTLRTVGQSFTIPAGWPLALNAAVLDDCGNPLNAGSVVASFSNGDPSLSLQSLNNNGQWQATWNPTNQESPQLTITLDAQSAQDLRGSLQVSGGLETTSDPPQIAPSGIVSGASFANGVPLSPGGIISLFGSQLADGSAGAAGLPLGSVLQGATVVIAGEAAPLFYASGGQINAVIPLDVTPNTSQQILVARDTTVSVPISVDVASSQPAVFLNPLSNAPRQGTVFAVRNTATGQSSFLAQASTPAAAGDTLVIYCAGLGAVDQTIAPGGGSPAAPAAKTKSQPQVTVGNQPASVQFSGLTPGLVGVYQINAVVPAGVAAGDQVPVVIGISGQTGPAVTIAVK